MGIGEATAIVGTKIKAMPRSWTKMAYRRLSMASPIALPVELSVFGVMGVFLIGPWPFLPGQVDFDGQVDRFRELGLVDDVFVQGADSQL